MYVGKSVTMVVKPGWKAPADNSSGGSVVGGGGRELPYSILTGASDVVGMRLRSQSGGTSGLRAREAARQRWVSVDSSATESSTLPATVGGLTSLSKPASTAFLPCPICNKKLPEDDINHHLDTCLSNQNYQGDPFEDDGDDDAALLAAAENHEKSIHIDSDHELLVNSNLIFSDSDDDEPLIKIN